MRKVADVAKCSFWDDRGKSAETDAFGAGAFAPDRGDVVALGDEGADEEEDGGDAEHDEGDADVVAFLGAQAHQGALGGEGEDQGGDDDEGEGNVTHDLFIALWRGGAKGDLWEKGRARLGKPCDGKACGGYPELGTGRADGRSGGVGLCL